MHYSFKCELEAAESACHINIKFEDNTVSQHTAKDWFTLLRTEDPYLENLFWSGRSSGLNNVCLYQLAKEDLWDTAYQRVEALEVSQSTIVELLWSLGSVSNPLQWVGHLLTEMQRQRRVEAAALMLLLMCTKTSPTPLSPVMRVVCFMSIFSASSCDSHHGKTRNRYWSLSSIRKWSCCQWGKEAKVFGCSKFGHPSLASMCSFIANN